MFMKQVCFCIIKLQILGQASLKICCVLIAYQTSEFVVINSHRRNDISAEQNLTLLDSNNRPLRLKLFFT